MSENKANRLMYWYETRFAMHPNLTWYKQVRVTGLREVDSLTMGSLEPLPSIRMTFRGEDTITTVVKTQHNETSKKNYGGAFVNIDY